MKPAKMKEGLAYLMCDLNVVNTGHERYQRGFVIDRASGCTIGRITIYDGVYDHVKWYKGAEGCGKHAYQINGWALFSSTGHLLQKPVFTKLYDKAGQITKDKKAIHEAWRVANPSAKKRKGLQTPKRGPYLYELIREYYADKPSKVESNQAAVVRGYQMTRFTSQGNHQIKYCDNHQPVWSKKSMLQAAKTFLKANFRIVYERG